MSKEELLKYLIAEIDLIMHDKDYRFENANGTWYSRESCRDLTNEEVFEELRTELRQFADLEAKLAEYEKFMKDNEWDSVEEMQETLNKCEKKYFDIQKQLAESENQCRECKHLNKKIELNIKNKLMAENCELQKQLAEKDEQLEYFSKRNDEQEKQLEKQALFHRKSIKELQNQKAIEQLEQIINLFEPYENEEKDTILCANNGISFLEYIDNQIEELTHQHEDKGE